MIGYFGGVAFQVSSQHIKTFSDLTINSSQNFAGHKTLNGPELLEYTGQNARTCSLKISLNINMGINPEESLQELHDMFNSHEAFTFALDKNILGQWVIENMTENYTQITSNGKITAAEISLNLKEFL